MLQYNWRERTNITEYSTSTRQNLTSASLHLQASQLWSLMLDLYVYNSYKYKCGLAYTNTSLTDASTSTCLISKSKSLSSANTILQLQIGFSTRTSRISTSTSLTKTVTTVTSNNLITRFINLPITSTSLQVQMQFLISRNYNTYYDEFTLSILQSQPRFNDYSDSTTYCILAVRIKRNLLPKYCVVYNSYGFEHISSCHYLYSTCLFEWTSQKKNKMKNGCQKFSRTI